MGHPVDETFQLAKAEIISSVTDDVKHFDVNILVAICIPSVVRRDGNLSSLEVDLQNLQKVVIHQWKVRCWEL